MLFNQILHYLQQDFHFKIDSHYCESFVLNNTVLRFLHDEKAKISCPNQDSAGVLVPIFTDRLCDNHFDCEDGSDENGSMYECNQEKAGIYGLGFCIG